jgi:hypothetical protein
MAIVLLPSRTSFQSKSGVDGCGAINPSMLAGFGRWIRPLDRTQVKQSRFCSNPRFRGVDEGGRSDNVLAYEAVGSAQELCVAMAGFST